MNKKEKKLLKDIKKSLEKQIAEMRRGRILIKMALED